MHGETVKFTGAQRIYLIFSLEIDSATITINTFLTNEK